jgi:hypothetical protein
MGSVWFHEECVEFEGDLFFCSGCENYDFLHIMPKRNYTYVEVSLCADSLLGYGKITKFPSCSVMMIFANVRTQCSY